MFWSKKPKIQPKVANAFWVLDRELERMHTLFREAFRAGSRQSESNAGLYWKQLQEMQKVVMECAKESDAKLHEKIAEFALAGSTDDSDPTQTSGGR